MKTKGIIVAFFCTVVFWSCNDQLSENLSYNEDEINSSEILLRETVSSMNEFSRILSLLVAEDVEVRNFLREEALKMIDNDYDIFYPLIKNELVSGEKTFREYLLKYVSDEAEFIKLEESLPLLTIYVPELPSGFSAEVWDTTTEMPFITPNAVHDEGRMNYYQNGEILFDLETYEIPGFPTLVVKNCERIRLASNQTSLRSSGSNYEFIDEAFDGINNNMLRSIQMPSNELAPEIIPAYNLMGVTSAYWQRDNIYYSLTKASDTQGPLNRRMIEKIVSIKFSPQAYTKMADASADPKTTSKSAIVLLIDKSENNDPNGATSDYLWTEGRFEIKIDVMVNNTSGLGTTLTKYFNAAPKDLFEVQYTTSLSGFPFTYVPTGVVGKEYNPNINLVTWDLENNGFSWLYSISEVDEQETVTRTITNSTQYASNFEFSSTSGEKNKIGIKWGASASRTSSSTFTVLTYKGSDDLGTLEANFSDPVILSTSNGTYSLYSISNPMVEMTIIPVRAY